MGALFGAGYFILCFLMGAGRWRRHFAQARLHRLLSVVSRHPRFRPPGRTPASRAFMFGATSLLAVPQVFGPRLSKATARSPRTAVRSTGTYESTRSIETNSTPPIIRGCRITVSGSRCRRHDNATVLYRKSNARASSRVRAPKISHDRLQSQKKSIRSPRSRLADLPLPTPQVSACAPWLPKRSPASDSAASP